MPVLAGWRFCPRCGGDLETARERVECPACGFVMYANAAPATQALVVDDRGRVLLGRRGIEPGRGRWDIPGGFLEEGEHPFDGLRREVREETGLEVEPVEFLCAALDPYAERTVLGLTWVARVVAGEARAGDDLVELRWFEPGELPAPGELAFASQPGVLAAWRAGDDGSHRGQS